MLIIGREVGQSIIVGEQVKVTVVQTGSHFGLDVDAPQDVNIFRIQQGSKVTKWIKGRSRKIGETVVIAQSTKVTIIQTESGLIRMAIDAPNEISVYREELYQNVEHKSFYFERLL